MAYQTFAVHPAHFRCFLFRGRPFKMVTSAEHYGAVLNGDFDYDVYLDEMARTGQNMTRVFTFYREHAGSIPGPGAVNSLAPRPEAAILPWERVPGHGAAADGLDKFDLERWNVVYFERFRDFLHKCGERGIVCEVVLFSNPYVQGRYDLFPFSPASAVQGVGAGLRTPLDFMTLQYADVVALQEQLVRRMAQELNAFDDLYFEICNEPRYYGGDNEETERLMVDWQMHLARVLRDAEGGLPRQHLVAVNAHLRVRVPAGPGEPDSRYDDVHYCKRPEIDLINYHYLSAKPKVRGLFFVDAPNREASAGSLWRFLRQRDSFGKPLVFDETYSGVVDGDPERYAMNRAEAWETMLSGAAGFNNLDWSFTQEDETGSGRAPIGDGRHVDGRPLREWLGVLRRLLARYDLVALVPAVGVLPDEIPGCGYAASTDGAGRYLLYLVDERVYQAGAAGQRPPEVTLTLPEGVYTARTLDPRTGSEADLPALHCDGTASFCLPEFDEDVAILLER